MTAARFEAELDQFSTARYVVADVTLRNRDDEAQPYNTFDWKLITPAGTIIDPTFGAEQLGSGDLVTGGESYCFSSSSNAVLPVTPVSSACRCGRS